MIRIWNGKVSEQTGIRGSPPGGEIGFGGAPEEDSRQVGGCDEGD